MKAWRHSWRQRWPTRIQRGGPLRSPPGASPGIGRRARASGWAASPPPPRRVRHRPLGVALRSPASQHHHRVMRTRCRIPTMDACFVSTHRGGAGTRSTGHGWPAPRQAASRTPWPQGTSFVGRGGGTCPSARLRRRAHGRPTPRRPAGRRAQPPLWQGASRTADVVLTAREPSQRPGEEGARAHARSVASPQSPLNAPEPGATGETAPEDVAPSWDQQGSGCRVACCKRCGAHHSAPTHQRTGGRIWEMSHGRFSASGWSIGWSRLGAGRGRRGAHPRVRHPQDRPARGPGGSKSAHRRDRPGGWPPGGAFHSQHDAGGCAERHQNSRLAGWRHEVGGPRGASHSGVRGPWSRCVCRQALSRQPGEPARAAMWYARAEGDF